MKRAPFGLIGIYDRLRQILDLNGMGCAEHNQTRSGVWCRVCDGVERAITASTDTATARGRDSWIAAAAAAAAARPAFTGLSSRLFSSAVAGDLCGGEQGDCGMLADR